MYLVKLAEQVIFSFLCTHILCRYIQNANFFLSVAHKFRNPWNDVGVGGGGGQKKVTSTSFAQEWILK